MDSKASVYYNLTCDYDVLGLYIEGATAVSTHVFAPLGADAGTLTAYTVQSLKYLETSNQTLEVINLLRSAKVAALRPIAEIVKGTSSKNELEISIPVFENSTKTLGGKNKSVLISKVLLIFNSKAAKSFK